MANSLANNFWIIPKLRHNSGGFSRYCLTAGIFAKVGWMTHEHETALPSIPPSQERLLRFRRHHQDLYQPQDQRQSRGKPTAHGDERGWQTARHEFESGPRLSPPLRPARER